MGVDQLPSSLLFVVCSFLTADAIKLLSVTAQSVWRECNKAGAWRFVHAPSHMFPTRWVQQRLTRSAATGQLKSVHVSVNSRQLEWLMGIDTLESVRLHCNDMIMYSLSAAACLPRLRVLDLTNVVLSGDSGNSVGCLPAGLEIVRAAFCDSLDCLAACQNLRVLQLRNLCPDLSVLPKLAGLQDLTLYSARAGGLAMVAQCTRLVALRILYGYYLDLTPLRGLPHDGLRALSITGNHDKNLMVVSHFTRLHTLRMSVLRPCDLDHVLSPSLLRLDISGSPVFTKSPLSPLALGASPNLQEFHASDFQMRPGEIMRTVPQDDVYHCHLLRVLDLRATFLPSVHRLVENCPRLEILAVRTDGRHLDPLCRLPRLWNLDVSACDNVDMSVFYRFQSLRHVTLGRSSGPVCWASRTRQVEQLRTRGLVVTGFLKASYWDEGRPLAPVAAS